MDGMPRTGVTMAQAFIWILSEISVSTNCPSFLSSLCRVSLSQERYIRMFRCFDCARRDKDKLSWAYEIEINKGIRDIFLRQFI